MDDDQCLPYDVFNVYRNDQKFSVKRLLPLLMIIINRVWSNISLKKWIFLIY